MTPNEGDTTTDTLPDGGKITYEYHAESAPDPNAHKRIAKDMAEHDAISKHSLLIADGLYALLKHKRDADATAWVARYESINADKDKRIAEIEAE